MVVTLQTFSADSVSREDCLHHDRDFFLHGNIDDALGGVDGIREPVTHYTQHSGESSGSHGDSAGVSPEVALIPVVGGLALLYLGGKTVQESRHMSHEIAKERTCIAALEKEADKLRRNGHPDRANALQREISFRRRMLSEQVRASRMGYGAGGSVVVTGGATTLFGASQFSLGLGLGGAGAAAQQIAPPFACLAYFMSAVLFAGKTRDAHRQLGLIAQIEAKGQELLHNGDSTDDDIGEILIKFSAHERERLREERLDHGLTTAVTATGGTSALLGTLGVLAGLGWIGINVATMGTATIATAIGAGGLVGVKYVRSKRAKPRLQEAKELREHEDPLLHEGRVLHGLAQYILVNEEVLHLFADYVGMEPGLLITRLVETQDAFIAEQDLMQEGIL